MKHLYSVFGQRREHCNLLVFGVFVLGLGLNTHGFAAAPKVGSQAPGFYRMLLGDFEITALLDGTHPFPDAEVLTQPVAGGKRSKLFQTDSQKATALLAAADLTAPTEGSINAFLINTGSKLILVDSGAGTLYGACCGHLLDNLRSAGYKPEQVDAVLLTHLHADHVGGIAPSERIAFPNATIFATQIDADYWLSDANQAAAPSFLRPMFKGARASLQPYINEARFTPIAGTREIFTGITAIPAAGHTPGHTFYSVVSKGQTLLIWGDTVHVSSIQFPDPSITVQYDSDENLAEFTRRQVFAQAAEGKFWIAAAHISFPGIGHVVKHDADFSWVAAAYSGQSEHGFRAIVNVHAEMAADAAISSAIDHDDGF